MVNQHRQLLKLRGRPVFAQSAWKSYVTHVKFRNCSAVATKCRECDSLLASFNAQYTAEERERARLREVHNYKDSLKAYDINDL
jgi:hypothetical protein